MIWLRRIRQLSSPYACLHALYALGIVQSLASGVMSAVEVIQFFYNAENCLYVRKHFGNKEANAVMSHGVQLADLFEFLSAEEAMREFFHELETIRTLCVSLLASRRSTDVAGSKTRQRKNEKKFTNG